MSVLRSMPEPHFLKTAQDDGTLVTTSGIASKHANPPLRDYAGGTQAGVGGAQTYGNHGVAAVSVAQHA